MGYGDYGTVFWFPRFYVDTFGLLYIFTSLTCLFCDGSTYVSNERFVLHLMTLGGYFFISVEQVLGNFKFRGLFIWCSFIWSWLYFYFSPRFGEMIGLTSCIEYLGGC